MLNRPHVLAPGRLTFCTDIGYPPMEFYSDGQPTGADIEIGAEVAQRLGGEAAFIDEPVAGIIDALLAKKADAIINAFTDNAARRKRVVFVDYLEVGKTVVVPRGNPQRISGVSDLAGRRILVQADTANETSLRVLDEENQRLGLPPMWIAAFKGTTAETITRAAVALRAGLGDADFLDVINARWAAGDEAVEVAPVTVNREPYGIALRPSDRELQEGVLAAVRGMYEDGTMRAILARWEIEDLAFTDVAQVRLSG